MTGPMREPFDGDRANSNTKQITAFFHCRTCVEGGLRSDIEAGWTKYGLQVWCRRHNTNMVHVDFMDQTHPADTTARRS